MEHTKTCPSCGERIKKAALVCRYCQRDLHTDAKDTNGQFVRIRVKTGQKTYSGDVFVPERIKRLSDILNDKRNFVVLVNAVEETGLRDVPIGFLAINKNKAERIELAKKGNEESHFEGVSRIIEWK